MKAKFVFDKFVILLLLISLFCSCSQSEDNSSDYVVVQEISSELPSEASSEDESSEEVSVGTGEDDVPMGGDGLLRISEVMSNNDLFWEFEYEDWVEIYNPTEEDVSLSDYRISDDNNNVMKYSLPDIVVKGEGYVALSCAELGFSISKEGETVYLYCDTEGVIAHKFDVGLGEKNKSYTEDGVNDHPSPGFENTYEGYVAYRASLEQKLVINEIIASNSTVYSMNGEYYDLIELKNISEESINLNDYFISDDKKDLLAYNLPDITLKPGGFCVIAADGKNVPFKLSSSGDTVYLTHKDGTPVDALWFEECPPEISYGRAGDELVYFSSPTFGRENGSGETTLTASPVPSVEPGEYTSSFTLTFSGEGDMYYTIDGSEPTKNSEKYSDGIIVDKNVSIRIKAYDGAKIPSETVTCAYFFNETSNLPLLKITALDSDIWDESTGIYANPTKSWTKEINLSFFVNGTEEFNIDCGLSMFGSTGRYESKKSFKVKFRGKYGASSLDYKVFEDLDIDSFTDLVIRGGSQDWYFSGVRDEVATSLALSAETSLLVQSYRPVILYVNDTYMGIYFIRERINEDFVASHHNTSPDDVAIVRYGYRLEKGTSEDMEDWNALISFIKTKDMKDPDNYAYVCRYLDVESLADWYIFRAYAGDLDIDNIRYYRESKDAKWKLIFFDLDLGFFGTKSPLTKITGSSSDYSSFNVPIRYLKVNEEFKALFLERLYYHAENTLSDEYVLGRIDYFEELLKADIPANNERWEEAYIADGKGSYFNYNFWISQMNYLRRIVSKNSHSRIALVIEDAEKVFG